MMSENPQSSLYCGFLNPPWLEIQGGFKNLQNRSRRRQSAHFFSIIGVLAPTAVGGYDFLKPPCWRFVFEISGFTFQRRFANLGSKARV